MKNVIKSYSDTNKKQQNVINRAICAESLTLKQVAKSIPTAKMNIKDVGEVHVGAYLSTMFGIQYAGKPTFNACNIAKAWHKNMKVDGKLAMYVPVTLQCVPTDADVLSALESNADAPKPIDLYTLSVDEDGNELYEKVTYTQLVQIPECAWSVRRIIKAFTQKNTFDTCKLESEESMNTAAKALNAHKKAMETLGKQPADVKNTDVLYFCKGFTMITDKHGKKQRQYEYAPLTKVGAEFNLKVED